MDVSQRWVPPAPVGEAYASFPRKCRGQMALEFPVEGRADGLTWGFNGIRCDVEDNYIPEGGINAAGMAINFGEYNYAIGKVADADPFVRDGLGYKFWDLSLQLCASAICPVRLAMRAAELCGLQEEAVGSMVAINSTDAWNIEIISGHNVMAERIPEDAFILMTNTYGATGDLDFADPQAFLSTPGIYDMAADVGWDPATPFDPVAIFGAFSTSAFNRKVRLHELYAPAYTAARDITYNSSTTKFSTFVRPEGPVTFERLWASASDHYESNPAMFIPYDQQNPHTSPKKPP